MAMTDKKAGSSEAQLGSEVRVEQSPLPGPMSDGLLRDFEELGLSAYEARVLFALMRLQSGNTLQIARLSGVPRTSLYQILEGLETKGVAERLPQKSPAVWVSPRREQVVNRLEALQDEWLRVQQARLARLRDTLEKALPDAPSPALPYVRFVRSAAQHKESFERLFAEARSEILALSKPPYSWNLGTPNPAVVAALGRNLPTRAIYEGSLQDPREQALRREIEAYIEAGADARVVDELPVKLTIADRRVVMLALTGSVDAEVGYPTTLQIEHPGFASLLADAFERRWETARPYDPLPVEHKGADS